MLSVTVQGAPSHSRAVESSQSWQPMRRLAVSEGAQLAPLAAKPMPVVGAGDRKKYPALRTARDGGHDGKEEQGSRGTMHAVARHAQILRVGCLRPCFRGDVGPGSWNAARKGSRDRDTPRRWRASADMCPGPGSFGRR